MFGSLLSLPLLFLLSRCPVTSVVGDYSSVRLFIASGVSLTDCLSLFLQREEAPSLGRPLSTVRVLFWIAPPHPVGPGVRVLSFDSRRLYLGKCHVWLNVRISCCYCFFRYCPFSSMVPGDLRVSEETRQSVRSLRWTCFSPTIFRCFSSA